MSNLRVYAEREMKLAGLYDADSDYGGMIPEAVLGMIDAHDKQDHSGGSHWLTMQIFNKVANFKPLTPISSNPSEWQHVGKDSRGECYQSLRCSTVFSYDEGKTWYDIDDRKKNNWPNRKWYQKIMDRFA